MRAEAAARSAAAIVPESKWEMDGEQEEVAGDLTGGSFCAREGRRKEFVERGGAPVSGNDGRRSELDSARVGARPSLWRTGGASGRGCAAQSARKSIGGGEARPVERRRRALLAFACCSEEGEGEHGTGQEPSRRSRG